MKRKKRDWKKNPPRSFEEAKAMMRELLEEACDFAAHTLGEKRPRIEDRGDRFVVVWPDGEITNEMIYQDISDTQDFCA